MTTAITKGALGRALETALQASFLADVATDDMTHDDIEGGARGQE
jgi:hypothetical protein